MRVHGTVVVAHGFSKRPSNVQRVDSERVQLLVWSIPRDILSTVNKHGVWLYGERSLRQSDLRSIVASVLSIRDTRMSTEKDSPRSEQPT